MVTLSVEEVLLGPMLTRASNDIQWHHCILRLGDQRSCRNHHEGPEIWLGCLAGVRSPYQGARWSCARGQQKDNLVVGVAHRRMLRQKCSLRSRKFGSDDRLGIRILPETLETMLGAATAGRRSNFAHSGASSGRLISTNSPGKMVVEVGGARRTKAQRAAVLTTAGTSNP